ncbi:MAG: hypothetical protein L7F78_13345, partial [Syntrophales bacterium LBB04]|nr:hypothetical protein [Syntrophales bacterium LBB04]
MNVYLTDITAFLPNEPVANEAIEQILGSTDSVPSALKEKILQKSHIHQRYYALHPVTQTRTHSNAQLTAAAIRQLSPYPGFTVQEMACLCCGTSTPDQWMPGHGAMVHAELGQGAYEVVQTAGTALAGVTSLKYAA